MMIRQFSLLLFFIFYGLAGCSARFYRPVPPIPSATVVTAQILSLIPASGPSGGGTSLTIHGANFTSGMQVWLGGSACLNVIVVSPTTLTCTTPDAAAGSVDVSLGAGAGSVAILPHAYAFIAPPLPTPGFAFSSGGTYSGTGAGMTMQATVRRMGRPIQQTGDGVVNLLGMP